jgi:hypothetical protein
VRPIENTRGIYAPPAYTILIAEFYETETQVVWNVPYEMLWGADHKISDILFVLTAHQDRYRSQTPMIHQTNSDTHEKKKVETQYFWYPIGLFGFLWSYSPKTKERKASLFPEQKYLFSEYFSPPTVPR